MRLTGAQEHLLSLGIWAWLAIIEQEREQLSERGRVALALLREDLERLAVDERGEAQAA